MPRPRLGALSSGSAALKTSIICRYGSSLVFIAHSPIGNEIDQGHYMLTIPDGTAFEKT